MQKESADPTSEPISPCSYVEKRAGSAKPSFIGKLLDDFDASGSMDSEHEYDLKMVGAGMYTGENYGHNYERYMYSTSHRRSRDGEFHSPCSD